MKLAIIGMGNMGSWLARELSRNNETAVFDIDPCRVEKITGSPSVRVFQDLGELRGFNPGMLINAVSLQNTVGLFREVEESLSSGCILCDIASIKGDIPEYYKAAGFRFVSIHPMFGPTFSDLERLRQENAVIIKESDEEGKSFFRSFFEKLGLTIYEYSSEEHDRMMAYSLGLPFISSMVFAACMNNEAVPGSTFAKHTLIAQGLMSEDDRLLSEILFNTYTINELEKVTSKLEFLKHVIRGRDYEEAKRFFDKLRVNIR
jgi:prephenate dehydrogenase